jgi:hypothetical protein
MGSSEIILLIERLWRKLWIIAHPKDAHVTIDFAVLGTAKSTTK